MGYFFVQTILAARNSDVEGWMNILLMVVLAVFYGLGSIIKARADRKTRDNDQNQLIRKPARESHRQPGIPAGPVPPRLYRLPGRIGRSQTAVRKVAVREAKPIRVSVPETLETLKMPPLIRRVQPDLEETQVFTGKTAKKLQAKHTSVALTEAERPVAKLTVEPLLDYTDSDKLKRAILHYEILGKPLSLRD